MVVISLSDNCSDDGSGNNDSDDSDIENERRVSREDKSNVS
jgi:hypothetical protein